jgi:hypothetical protein
MRIKVIIIVVYILSISLSFYIGTMLSFLIEDKNFKLEDFTPVYIAPYTSNTHACTFHADSCTGELPNILVRYNVSSDDDIIQMKGEIFTKSNGFLTLYIPRNKSYEINMIIIIDSIDYKGFTGFAAYPGSPNCITTSQLFAF